MSTSYYVVGRLPWSEDSYFDSFCKTFSGAEKINNNNNNISDNIESTETNVDVNVDVDPRLIEEEWIKYVSLYKESMDPYTICGPSHCNDVITLVIVKILNHARSLRLEEKPDFTYLYGVLNDAMQECVLQQTNRDTTITTINNNDNNKYDNNNINQQSVHRDLFEWERDGIHWSTIDGCVTHDY